MILLQGFCPLKIIITQFPAWWIPSLSDDQGMIAMLWRSEVEPDRPREKVTRAMTAKKFIKKCD